jgi:hypothetical protein
VSRPSGSDLQRAVRFLSSPEFAKRSDLPPNPDYRFLAACASEPGHELSPEVLQEAFRLIMRARLVALRKPGHGADPHR